MSRTPLREAYDAEVLLMPLRGETSHAHALFKLTYAIEPGRCTRIAAEPLLHDWRDPELDRTMLGASDFWLAKPFTDLVVQGAACAPGGKEVASMVAGVRLGGARKELAVWGRREVRWNAGRPLIGQPQPFSSVPLTWANAYGGIDWRVAVPGAGLLTSFGLPVEALRTRFDHPGMYPRNPFGTGYLVESGEVPDLIAPALEDPADPLTAERLVSRDPAAWWRQPLPWCLDWTSPVMFPRACWFSPEVEPWFPAPDDRSLPEIARGLISEGFLRSRCPGGTIDARFFQGASSGLILSRPERGQVLTFIGMHPEHPELTLPLPATEAEITFEIEGRRSAQRARLHHIVCRPNELRLNLVFAAEAPLPRPFIPGIHKHIPVSASLDRDTPVPYIAPATVLERIAAAKGSSA